MAALPCGALRRKWVRKPRFADRRLHLARAEVRARAHAEGDHARQRRAAPQARERIVRIDDGGRRIAQARDHLAFRARHALERAEALEVLGARVGDEAHARARERHQRGHLAGAVGAHLDHREAVRGRQAQQRQRHADVVVQVAARGERLAGLRQDRRRHLLGGGLAVAAGHADQRAAEVRAPGARGLLERRLRVAHHDLRQRHRLRRAHHRAGGPGGVRRGHEIIAVELRSAQRDEQLPGRERARIAHHVAEGGIGAGQATTAQARELGERALHGGSRASSWLTTV